MGVHDKLPDSMPPNGCHSRDEYGHYAACKELGTGKVNSNGLHMRRELGMEFPCERHGHRDHSDGDIVPLVALCCACLVIQLS